MAAEDQGLAVRLEGLPAPVRLWLTPVQPALEVVAATKDKPVGQMTGIEVVAWAYVFSYAVLTGMVIGRLAANVAVVALRGPVRR